MSSPRRTPSLSPPPLKRRRISPPSSKPPPTKIPESIPSTAPPVLRILSWNINGIKPFLPSTGLHNQRPITNFFAPTQSAPKPRGDAPTTNPRDHEAPNLRTCLRRWRWPAVVCLQEVKIAPDDKATQQALKHAVNPQETAEGSDHEDKPDSERHDGGPRYEAHFSLPRDSHNARGPGGKGRVYGVCTIIRQDLVDKGASVKRVGWDLEGRVSVIEIPTSATSTAAREPPPKGPLGREDEHENLSSPPAAATASTQEHPPETTLGMDNAFEKSLVVFNVYAVNGTDFPYRSPTTGTIISDRHAFKRRFHALLAHETGKYEQDGCDVIIAGDINISRGPLDSYPKQRMGGEHVANRRDFEEKFMERPNSGDIGNERGGGGLGMIDTFRHIHAEEKKYTYHPLGRRWGEGMDRVDLILCSKSMVAGGDNRAGEGEGRHLGKSNAGWWLVDADILDTEAERGASDHVPLYVDVARVEDG